MGERRSPRPTKKVLVRLYESDISALKKYFPKAGYNAAIRVLVARQVRLLDEKTSAVLEREAMLDTEALKEETSHGS